MVEPALAANEQRVVVGLRRVRQIVDEADRDGVADYVNVAGERGTGCVDDARVRTPGIDGAETGLRVVGLYILFELEPEGSEVADLEDDVLRQFTLYGTVPLKHVAVALVQVDAGRLNLHRSDGRGSENIEAEVTGEPTPGC